MRILSTLAFLVAGQVGFAQANDGVDPRRVTPVVRVAQKAGPSVVSITTERVSERVVPPLFRVPGEDHIVADEKMILGSGLIFDPEGYVVTNYHVVNQASRITVHLIDGSQLPAELVNWDEEVDLAVIRIQTETGRPFPWLPVGRSDDLLAGEPVVALGNPFGLGTSVTTGVVSAKSRPVLYEGKEIYKDLIQTDVLINPGNSGGPLLNIVGTVIGINTGIIAEGQGIGFAIPADRVRESLSRLLDFRSEKMIRIGIESRNFAARKEGGLLVLRLDSSGPCGKAGMLAGDVIHAVGTHPVRDVFDFNFALFKKSVGEKISLEVRRKGLDRKFNIDLARVEDLLWERLGIAARQLTEDLAARIEVPIRLRYGVYVTEVDPTGPCQKLGVRPGDLIYVLGQHQVNGVESLRSLLETRLLPGPLLNVFLWRAETMEELQGQTRLRGK